MEKVYYINPYNNKLLQWEEKFLIIKEYLKLDYSALLFGYTGLPCTSLSFKIYVGSSGQTWHISNSEPSWINISNTNGVGNATINVSVDANSGSQRVGSLTVSCNYADSQSLTITQLANGNNCP